MKILKFRFIENGYKVKLIKLSDKSKSVDTKDDMRKVAKITKYDVYFFFKKIIFYRRYNS